MVVANIEVMETTGSFAERDTSPTENQLEIVSSMKVAFDHVSGITSLPMFWRSEMLLYTDI